MGQPTQEVAQTGSNKSSDVTSTVSNATQKTTETVSSVSAGLGGQFSGAFNLGGSANSRSVTHESGGLSKSEADKLYEERIEDEYAKREGGA